jgi:hypothetical protein
MSRPSQSMNAPVRPTTAESITITRYRTVDVDGLKLFYREAGALRGSRAASVARLPDLFSHVSGPHSGACGPLPRYCS